MLDRSTKSSVKDSSNRFNILYKKLFIPILLLSLIEFIFIVLLLSRNAKVMNYQTNAVAPAAKTDKQTKNLSPYVNQNIETGISGYILYIKDGDLWRTDPDGDEKMKLIDLDKIRSVKQSSTGNYIGYTLEEKVIENVNDYDGSKKDEEVSRYDLFLADKLGANSILIGKAVAQWGFISKTDLVWFESSEIKKFYDSWQFLGNGIMSIFNPESSTIEKAVETKSFYKPMWSPDGRYVSYISSNFLKIYNRFTKKTTDLFELPYVGGDRGGPQPIPYFKWSSDSSSVLTIFSSWVLPEYRTTPLEVPYKEKLVTILNLPISESPSIIFNDIPSDLFSEETYPRAFVNDTQTRFFYPVTSDYHSFKYYVYDLEDNKSYLIFSGNLEDENYSQVARNLPTIWFENDSFYILRHRGVWNKGEIFVTKFDYKNDNKETIIKPFETTDFIRNIQFIPGKQRLFFSSDDGRLFSIGTDNWFVVAEGLDRNSSVDYHLK